ncbi:MAG: bifunctional glutamate N-acetyltransferase/amino-acid acetyltransferase ArgJ [Luteitalea sp.]|nr:bifunctional glutamate N-acetyltransferase/amino-acid acetyltransferase ArgJ [Luteitalea sp.]
MTGGLEQGVTAPRGFRAAGVRCGIKAVGRDLALIVSDRTASAAALFTTNRAVAAPVLVSREHLQATAGRARAVVTNSGCANACTGKAGLEAAALMASAVARAIGCAAEEVLVASTGVIGVPLDVHKVASGVVAAAEQLDASAGGADAAEAIMTTDARPKAHAVEVSTTAGMVRIGGMAKGAGMIEPNLATMLAFLTTDAAVETSLLRRALVDACEDTFNAITVDGECSTNDAVFLLANGASGVTIDASDYDVFVEGLRAVCRHLAIEIVRGGEGATKLVTVQVTGARTYDEAKRAARALANSLLVKTALNGGDPNWGRLLAVAGRAGVTFALPTARAAIGPVILYEHGRPHDTRSEDAARYLEGRDVTVSVDLGAGGHDEATIWTCDLSAEYVRINSEYRT